jgi:hypothetical protein
MDAFVYKYYLKIVLGLHFDPYGDGQEVGFEVCTIDAYLIGSGAPTRKLHCLLGLRC